MPPEVTNTTGASSENSPAAVRELGSPRRTGLGSSTSPRTPRHRAAGQHELVDLVAEAQLDQPARGRLAHAPHERLEHARARCPR